MIGYLEHNLALLARLRGILAALGESEPTVNEGHQLFIERVDDLIKLLPQAPEQLHLGQELLSQVFLRYPQIGHLVPRDLLWFFGGDCLHYMPDEEIGLYQTLDERRHLAESQGQPFDWSTEFLALLAEQKTLH